MNSVQACGPGPPVSSTIRVNTVANTRSSKIIYMAPMIHRAPKFVIRITASIMKPVIHACLSIMLLASCRSALLDVDICLAPSSRDLLSSAPS